MDCISQKIKAGERSICPACFHYDVCKATKNQPCIECTQFVPAADVVPVRHGRWLRGNMPTYGGYKCSVCGGNTVHHKANYCPSCGALMKDGDGDV